MLLKYLARNRFGAAVSLEANHGLSSSPPRSRRGYDYTQDADKAVQGRKQRRKAQMVDTDRTMHRT
jgi:hypothetical protein